MGSKGDTVVEAPEPQMEREQSPDELRLLQTQAKAMELGMATSGEADARARQMQDIWTETYLPIETGMIHGDASEENGYMDSASMARVLNSDNYKAEDYASSGSSAKGGAGIQQTEPCPEGTEWCSVQGACVPNGTSVASQVAQTQNASPGSSGISGLPEQGTQAYSDFIAENNAFLSNRREGR